MDSLGFVVEQFPEGVDILLFLGADEDAVLAHAGHPAFLKFFQGDVLALSGCEIILILGRLGKLVYLVEDHDHLFVAGITHFLKRAVHHLNLFLKLGM